MISHRLPRRSLLTPILVAIFASAGEVDAQLEFAGIPWGTSEAQATERIRERAWSAPTAGSPDDVALREACEVLGWRP